MVEEAAAENKLYDAATIGNVETFHQLLQQHPHFLHVVSFPYLRNALHIAITEGHINIVEEVLKIKPQLARDVDSKKSSSLHIAAEQGNVEISKKLFEVAPGMCSWLDDQGMNPVHIAAMNGHVEFLEELLQQDLFPALERVHRGKTVLHLCVKHRQIRALVFLAEKLGDLASAKDDDGETLLHLAVRSNQFEMVRYLVQSKKIKDIALNSMGKTALDILKEESRDTSTYSEIKDMLELLSDESIVKSLPKMSDMTMIVVVLIATMAFQATVSPPGGVWQEDTSSHKAGQAVMASTRPNMYKHFVRANNTAFVSSLITIFLISSEVPSQNVYFMWIPLLAMFVSLTSIGVSYGASLIMTNPMETHSIGHIVAIIVPLFIGLFVFTVFVELKCINRKKRQREKLTIDELISRASHPGESFDEVRRTERQNSILASLSRRMPASPSSRDTVNAA